jgi:hypothetical protein
MHHDDGNRFIVRADELLKAFLEFESVIRVERSVNMPTGSFRTLLESFAPQIGALPERTTYTQEELLKPQFLLGKKTSYGSITLLSMLLIGRLGLLSLA